MAALEVATCKAICDGMVSDIMAAGNAAVVAAVVVAVALAVGIRGEVIAWAGEAATVGVDYGDDGAWRMVDVWRLKSVAEARQPRQKSHRKSFSAAAGRRQRRNLRERRRKDFRVMCVCSLLSFRKRRSGALITLFVSISLAMVKDDILERIHVFSRYGHRTSAHLEIFKATINSKAMMITPIKSKYILPNEAR
nr:hypothetical protein [Tanacetum cinerariifolium]